MKTFSIFFVLATLLFANYNLPVFQQIFAHYFYQEAEGKQKGGGDFSCTWGSIALADIILDRNEFSGGPTGSQVYEYQVGGKQYRSQTKSYIRKYFSCDDKIFKVYFFSLHPAWSIADNSLPGASFIVKNFFISSGAWIVVCIAYLRFLKARPTKISETK